MTIGAGVLTILLGLAAILALHRIARGPSVLDRIVGVEVLVSTIITALATYAAYHHDATTLPILVTLSMLGFVGSAAVARLASRRTRGSEDAS